MNKLILIILLVLLSCWGCDDTSYHGRYSGGSNSNNSWNKNSTQNTYYQNNQKANTSLYNQKINYSNTTRPRTTFNSSGYKYNYKVGGTYNYDVSGYDDVGNAVTGNVDIDRDGEGYIIDEDGNEKSITVEWTGYGEMEGYDEDGNCYELEVD
jgi:hypothetical protein